MLRCRYSAHTNDANERCRRHPKTTVINIFTADGGGSVVVVVVGNSRTGQRAINSFPPTSYLPQVISGADDFRNNVVQQLCGPCTAGLLLPKLVSTRRAIRKNRFCRQCGDKTDRGLKRFTTDPIFRRESECYEIITNGSWRVDRLFKSING